MQLHHHIQSPIVNTNKTPTYLEQLENLDPIFSWKILFFTWSYLVFQFFCYLANHNPPTDIQIKEIRSKPEPPKSVILI